MQDLFDLVIVKCLGYPDFHGYAATMALVSSGPQDNGAVPWQWPGRPQENKFLPCDLGFCGAADEGRQYQTVFP